MTLHRIKTLLYLRKIKPAEIAKLAGVSPHTVRVVLNGFGTSRNVQQVIADLLNRPYERVWDQSARHKTHSNKSKKGCK